MRISDLDTRSAALGDSTAYFAVDQASSNVTHKIDYNALARAIIEQYTGSTIGGAAQSVKAAVDALNSKSLSPKTAPSTNTLDDFVTPGVYWIRGSDYTDSPFVTFGFLEVNNYANSSNAVYQRYTRYDVTDESYNRVKANSIWSTWVKQPTRTEMNESYGLSYNTKTAIVENTDLNTLISPGSYVSKASAISSTLVNCPVTGTGFSLLVESIAGGTGQHILQTLKRQLNNLPEIYYRTYNGNSWGVWVKQSIDAS